jgi:O-antigen/teichoic acid export membrane protein
VLQGSEAVGLYGVSYKIFEFALVFPTFFVNSIYPILVRHYKDSRERLLRTVKLSGMFLLAVAVVGSLVGFALAPLMIRLVAGPEFGESVRALRLLLLGLPIFYLSALFLWLMITLGKQRQIPFIYAFGALVNVVLNLVFIPRYSFYASSVITWTSEALILGLLIYIGRKALQ